MHQLKRCGSALAVAAVAIAAVLAAALPIAAQQPGTVQGKVVEENSSLPLGGVQVRIPGTALGAVTGEAGEYRITGVPAGAHALRADRLGYDSAERTVTVVAGQTVDVNFTLAPAAVSLDGLVVTALGQTAKKRELGTAQQTVQGDVIAETQRTDFIDALQGRIAGVEVTSTSGVPGASSSITIRGVSSISSSNQPLMVVDGLPINNKTLNTEVLASDGNCPYRARSVPKSSIYRTILNERSYTSVHIKRVTICERYRWAYRYHCPRWAGNHVRREVV